MVVGNSRSGTTMTGRLIGNHSQVHTVSELHFFDFLASTEDITGDQTWDESRCRRALSRMFTTVRESFFVRPTAGRYDGEIDSVLEIAQSREPAEIYAAFLQHEKRRARTLHCCDQTPAYIYSINTILDAFPEVRVVNLVRDPRAVMLSQKNKWRRRYLGAKTIPLREAFRSWVNYHPYTVTKFWVSAVKNARAVEDDPRVLTVRFENLTGQPELEVKRICQFLGIEFEPNMINVPRIGSSTSKDAGSGTGIDGGNVERWRHGGLTALELALCEKVAGDEIRANDYPLYGFEANAVKYIMSGMALVLKSALILATNIRRFRSAGSVLRRRLRGT